MLSFGALETLFIIMLEDDETLNRLGDVVCLEVLSLDFESTILESSIEDKRWSAEQIECVIRFMLDLLSITRVPITVQFLETNGF